MVGAQRTFWQNRAALRRFPRSARAHADCPALEGFKSRQGRQVQRNLPRARALGPPFPLPHFVGKDCATPAAGTQQELPQVLLS